MSARAEYYDEAGRRAVLARLVGRSITSANMELGALTLSDGTILIFDNYNEECCSSIELAALNTTENVITAATFGDNEEQTGGEGPYRAWLHVVTEAGELNVAEANGDASNGYYLHGFALGVTVSGHADATAGPS